MILEGNGAGTLAEIGSALDRLMACVEARGSHRCAGVGFEIETATNGVHALIKAQSKLSPHHDDRRRYEPSVIISDIFAPSAGVQYRVSRLRTTTATENNRKTGGRICPAEVATRHQPYQRTRQPARCPGHYRERQ